MGSCVHALFHGVSVFFVSCTVFLVEFSVGVEIPFCVSACVFVYFFVNPSKRGQEWRYGFASTVYCGGCPMGNGGHRTYHIIKDLENLDVIATESAKYNPMSVNERLNKFGSPSEIASNETVSTKKHHEFALALQATPVAKLWSMHHHSNNNVHPLPARVDPQQRVQNNNIPNGTTAIGGRQSSSPPNWSWKSQCLSSGAQMMSIHFSGLQCPRPSTQAPGPRPVFFSVAHCEHLCLTCHVGSSRTVLNWQHHVCSCKYNASFLAALLCCHLDCTATLRRKLHITTVAGCIFIITPFTGREGMVDSWVSQTSRSSVRLFFFFFFFFFLKKKKKKSAVTFSTVNNKASSFAPKSRKRRAPKTANQNDRAARIHNGRAAEPKAGLLLEQRRQSRRHLKTSKCPYPQAPRGKNRLVADKCHLCLIFHSLRRRGPRATLSRDRTCQASHCGHPRFVIAITTVDMPAGQYLQRHEAMEVDRNIWLGRAPHTRREVHGRPRQRTVCICREVTQPCPWITPALRHLLALM